MRTLPVLSLGAFALALAAPTIAAPEGKPAGHDRSAPIARGPSSRRVRTASRTRWFSVTTWRTRRNVTSSISS